MSLKAQVLRGSAWTFAGHSGNQLIRLASSLILTRLLFPESFGVMSIVWAVMYGLDMLSDVGLGPAIIRDKRGDEPDFLNTAWTVQAVRGGILWIGACVIAYPAALFYSEPSLALLIPFGGLTSFVAGFASTGMHTCRRAMEFGRLTALELAGQVAGFVLTVLWAALHPTVWALVGGALITRVVLVLGSHFWLPGIRNRFRWEPSSLRVFTGFGRWIFLASICTFLATQSDRILLGHYLGMAQLGIYSIAILISGAVQALVIKINYGVLFPAFGRLAQNEGHRMRAVAGRARLGIDVSMVIPIAALVVLGQSMVQLLYDSRYHDAGWMLQILCIRPLMAASLTCSEVSLVALGQAQYAFIQNACRAVWILVMIPIGWNLAGIVGVVWAVGLSELPVLVVLWVGLARNRLLSLGAELRSLAFALLGGILGLGVLRVLQ